MDCLQFISAIVGHLVSLAWPIAFVFVFFLMRDKFRELLPLLRFKAGDVEMSFRLDRAEAAAAELPPAPVGPDAPPPPTPEEVDRFNQIAQLSPRAAIMELRNELERVVIRAAEPYLSRTSPPRVGRSFMLAIRALREAELIDPTTSRILDDLRNAGNSATNGDSPITLEDALRYRKLADEVITRLPSP